MNDQIKKLMAQATYDVLGVKQIDQQLFAELIIKECANIALREDHDPYECIKRHFGIK